MLTIPNGTMTNIKINPNVNQSNKYGLPPTPKNQQYLLNLTIDYCKEILNVEEDESGVIRTTLGITKIKDLGLLEEIIGFNYSGNYDRLVSFGHALAWARYLDYLGVMPSVRKSDNRLRQESLAKQNLKYNSSPLSLKSYSPY